MSNKNNNKTMNERTHNPIGTYKNKNKEASNSNNQHPEDPSREEFSTEFGSKPKNKKNNN